ncbi:MAG: N-acetyltransferase [Actinobacteria bacterium]|nr:N-acetyltransferase [Actinomycetota bacterium]
MSSRFSDVELLTAQHRLAEFDCGSDAQTIWLRRYAFQAHQSGTSRVHVVRRLEDDATVGYHALAAGAVLQESATARVVKGAGDHPIPVVILTRLGVDVEEQGKGLGVALLVDALRRVDAAADEIGVRALLIHCEDERAKSFYVHVAQFEESPTDPLHLMLLVKDLRKVLGQ